MFNLFNTVYYQILHNLGKIDKQVLKMMHILSESLFIFLVTSNCELKSLLFLSKHMQHLKTS